MSWYHQKYRRLVSNIAANSPVVQYYFPAWAGDDISRILSSNNSELHNTRKLALEAPIQQFCHEPANTLYYIFLILAHERRKYFYYPENKIFWHDVIKGVQLFCWHKVIKSSHPTNEWILWFRNVWKVGRKQAEIWVGYYDVMTGGFVGSLSPNFGHNKVWLAITKHWPLLSSAPPYCGPHAVSSQGWNYPGERGEKETPANIHTVDLSAHPPYHPPPENFKIPNGHIGSDSGSDGDASMTSATDVNMVDSNRNITWVTSMSYQMKWTNKGQTGERSICFLFED